MKHRVSRDIYEYWNARRGTRNAPNRSEIDPAAIRSVLADSFMLNRERGASAEFRLAGTRICDMFGRELKGERFLTLWDAGSHDDLRMLLDLAASHTQGFVAGVVAQSDDGNPVNLELLLLPLHRAGATEARSIGSLAMLKSAVDARMERMSGLRLEGWRFVGPEPEMGLHPRDMALPPEAHIRFGMIVVPGGRR